MCSETTATTVTRLQDKGMITLRANLSDPAVRSAVSAAGLMCPEQRGIVSAPAARVAWMSPDELLVVCAAESVTEVLAQIAQAFEGLHHLAVSVGGARVCFELNGPDADLVLAQLCPVDLAKFPEGEVRRTRLAQIPAAFWREDAGRMTLICFRSVSDYAQGLLENAARHTEAVNLP